VARRPLEREGICLDGGRCTTQLMRFVRPLLDLMTRSAFVTVIALVLAALGCHQPAATPLASIDSAQALATATRLTRPIQYPGFHVTDFSQDTAGYLIDFGPADSVAALTVGGRVTVRVRHDGEASIIFMDQ